MTQGENSINNRPGNATKPLISFWGALSSAALLLAAVISLAGCAALEREPGIPIPATNTAPPATPTPTPVPVIEIESVTARAVQDPGRWDIFGLIENISNDDLTDLELQVSLLNEEGEVQTEATFLPALRQLSPGEETAFRAQFDELDIAVQSGQILVELASYQPGPITPLQITVDQVSVRPDSQGGATYLGYFSNASPERGELRNVEAYMMDDDGRPIDFADLTLTISIIEPYGKVPFRVDFSGDHGDKWPVFFIDAVPLRDTTQPTPLWSVTEPRLFFTDQGIAYYVLEIENTAFAPQVFEGVFTLFDDLELAGVLPIRSPAPIRAQSSWFFTIEPGLALPVRLRSDPEAMRDLTVDVTLDPAASHGVSDEVVIIDLEIQSVERTGSSLHMKGILSNPTADTLASPLLSAVLRNTRGDVVSASTALVADKLPADGRLEFTIALWIPAGTDLPSLEFDLSAFAVKPAGAGTQKPE
ncbi:MAG: FxLYD domain-containing protein [Anaerolineales bacterium]|nr:FxLYD domain-containing protein [Anaerolineales bacterium]